MKKLTKSRMDSKIAGVCGGLGVYLGIDSTIIRLLFVIFAFMGGSAIIPYIIMACIIPTETDIFEQ